MQLELVTLDFFSKAQHFLSVADYSLFKGSSGSFGKEKGKRRATVQRDVFDDVETAMFASAQNDLSGTRAEIWLPARILSDRRQWWHLGLEVKLSGPCWKGHPPARPRCTLEPARLIVHAPLCPKASSSFARREPRPSPARINSSAVLCAITFESDWQASSL